MLIVPKAAPRQRQRQCHAESSALSLTSPPRPQLLWEPCTSPSRNTVPPSHRADWVRPPRWRRQCACIRLPSHGRGGIGVARGLQPRSLLAERCGASQRNVIKATRGAIALNSETMSRQRGRRSLWLDGRGHRFPDLGFQILHVVNLVRVHPGLADGVGRPMLSLVSAPQSGH
jgi:hypothetical protein